MSKQTCKTILGLCVVLILTAIPGAAGAKKFAGEFMSLGGGARALGMGGAFAAVADDASTLYWNPAGISGFEKRQALFMHSETFGDLLNYNFAAFVAPTSAFGSADREGSFGFALVHLGVDDILITKDLPFEERNGIPGFQGGEDRLLYDVDALPKEGSNDFALFGSFAMNTDAGRLGGTLKLIYSDQVAGYSATGIGVDVGYLRRDVLTGGFDVGVKVQDLTGTYIGWSTGTVEFIAPSVKLGLAYRIAAPTLNASFIVSADGDFFFEDRRQASQFWVEGLSADLHMGGEITFQERVMVRGGMDGDWGNYTAGAGLRIGMVGLDYAYLRFADDYFEGSHRVSALVDF